MEIKKCLHCEAVGGPSHGGHQTHGGPLEQGRQLPFAASQDNAKKSPPWGPLSLKLLLLHPATPSSSTSTVLSYEFKRDLNINMASKIIILLAKANQEYKLLDCICIYE
jgi:hypothetical protein